MVPTAAWWCPDLNQEKERGTGRCLSGTYEPLAFPDHCLSFLFGLDPEWNGLHHQCLLSTLYEQIDRVTQSCCLKKSTWHMAPASRPQYPGYMSLALRSPVDNNLSPFQ
jgi:hypothetical protein